MSISIDRIKNLLGNGLSNEVVASTIGVHPSYITQLMSDEKFHNEVIELRTQALASHTIRDRSLDAIEDTLIKKIDDAVTSNMIYKPGDLLAAFRVINAAKRRGVSTVDSTVINNTVVNLSLSQKAVVSFRTNANNEVVEVEGKTMVTMPAASLLDKLAKLKEGSAQAVMYEKVKKFLPQGTMTPGQDTTKIIDHLDQQSSQGNPINVRKQRLLRGEAGAD